MNEYLTEIEECARQAAKSQRSYDAAVANEEAAIEAKTIALHKWQHDTALLSAAVRLYVKAIIEK